MKSGALVSTAHFLTAETKDPVVKLGAAGCVTGRAVGKDGKPLADVRVTIGYTRREVEEAFRRLAGSGHVVTDANGEFRAEGVFPGQEFRVIFYRNRQRFGPGLRRGPRNTPSPEHGDDAQARHPDSS